MQIPTKTVLSLVAIVAISGYIGALPAFADHMEASVSIPEGTSVPGCEENNQCFVPYEVTIDVGGEVTWSNDDTAAHTVTAGSAKDGPSGVFDSSLFMSGTTFSHKFEDAGQFTYFCMVHPWMQGIVTVQAETEPEPGDGTIIVGAPPEDETTVTGISSDGKLRAEITASNPVENEVMTLEIKFRDSTGSIQKHANYDIVVSQNGNEILAVQGAHEHEGIGIHSTTPLASEDAVDIKITVNGFGLPDDEENWTGPRGEIFMLNVVPEFGTIGIMILALAIISIIVMSAKTKLSIMPKL